MMHASDRGAPALGTLSPWQLDAPVPAWPALEGDLSTDVLVVGAGLAGLGVARALEARGRRVLVVDALGPGGGASGRNAGFLLRAHLWAFPGLRARVGADVARALLRLAEDTHTRVAEVAAHAAVPYRRCGTLMLAATDDERDAIATAARALSELGVRTEPARVPPALRGYRAAVALPDDGEVHPMRLVGALAAGLEGRRAHVASRLAPHVVSAGAHRIEHRMLVLATNAWTSALAPAIEVAPARAQMLCTAPLPRALEQPCYARLGFDYFRQRDDGRVLVGGLRDRFRASEATPEPEPSAEVQAGLDALVRAHLPFAASAPVERRWAGTMGLSPDELPYVGEGEGGVYFVCGFTGHGLGTALGCAELCARSITGEPWPDDLAVLEAALSPVRARSARAARASTTRRPQ